MLREISLIWSFFHTVVLFLLLFESRYSKKKTMVITLVTMIPLILVNFCLALFLAPDKMAVFLLVSLSLPSMIVFLILAKHRDGRFFFTFCFVDTVVLEIIYLSQIVNHYVSPEIDLLLFLARLIIFPILEWLIYRYLRPIFLEVQKRSKEGWGLFAVIGALFYVLMTLAVNYPVAVTQRPEYLPEVILLLSLIPVIYLHIIITLRRQQNLSEISEQEDILKLQVSNMTSRIQELSAAEERFREERHNYRHKMKTIASLVETEQYDELAALVEDYSEVYQRTQVVRYSHSAVIDAVLSTYIRSAENKGIKVNVGFAFPDPIPVNENELATVFANAIENAIHACEKLDPEKRFIDIKVLNRPGFMVQIVNSFDGKIEFGEDDVPLNRAEGHGFGTRSIVTFCKKYGVHYIFKADAGKFTLYLNF